MPTLHNQVLIHWTDTAGRKATTFWTLSNQSSAVPAPLLSLANSLSLVSDCVIDAVQLQTTNLIGLSGGTGAYRTVQDRCHLLGVVGGATVHYDIIGPKEDIFLSDHKTMNLGDWRVQSVIDNMKAVVGNSAGLSLVSVKRGLRQWAGPRS